ncbi:MAG: polyketide synthase [Rubripirellula sp.]
MRKHDQIAPELTQLLQNTRRRIRRFIALDSLLALFGLFAAAFWVGFLLDYLPVRFGGTEMPRSARGIFLASTVALIGFASIKWLFIRLIRPLPDASLALLIERLHPQIGGRLTTAVELLGSERTIDDHSKSLLDQVHRQATQLISQVETSRLLRRDTLIKKWLVTVPLTLAIACFLLLDPASLALAAKRLSLLSDATWPRRAELQMVGIELPSVLASEEATDQVEEVVFKDKYARLPAGSSSTLRIRAKAVDAELPSVCTVYYKTDSGAKGQSNMRRVGRVVDGYQHFVLDGPPLTDLNDSVTLDIRGLDARLDDYRIEAVDPPAVTETLVSVVYPGYLKQQDNQATDWSRGYQTGIRIEEGSTVELQIKSTTPLGSVDLWIQNQVGSAGMPSVKITDDGMLASFSLPNFQSPATINLVPRDKTNITAQTPYRYFLGVIKDEPPEMGLKLQGIGTVITAKAKLPMETTVRDDYGAYQSAITVAASQRDTNAENKPLTLPDGKSQPPTSNQGDPDSEASDPTTTDSSLAKSEEAAAIPLPDGSGEESVTADLRELIAQKQLPDLQPGFTIDLIGETQDRYDLGQRHLTRTQVIRLPVVSDEALLAYLERRELSLRARLEQTLEESRRLRDSIAKFTSEATISKASETPTTEESGLKTQNESITDVSETAGSVNRDDQVRRLRIQQAMLQSQKTRDELIGVAASLDDILLEMQNNRVDSADRQDRLGSGVRDPIQLIIKGSLQDLLDELQELQDASSNNDTGSETSNAAIAACERVILELTAVLEKMLDLESYNEILDLVRGLIEDQNNLTEDTKSERKKKVLDLFK